MYLPKLYPGPTILSQTSFGLVVMVMMMQDDDDGDDDDDDQEKDGEEAGAAVQMALGEIQELGGHGQGPETAEAIEVVNHSLQLQSSTINMMS